MEIRLPVGVHADELEPQALWVSLTAAGTAPASPQSLDQCFDYEPLWRWLTHEWPRTPHTPLLETRINQLLGFVFSLDERLQTIWVGMYKQRVSRHAVAVGIERQASRLEFEALERHLASAAVQKPAQGAASEREAHAAVQC